MIHFRAITDENYTELIQIKEKDGFCFETDFNFIQDSLAMAWLNREKGNMFPFAIYHDETLVGFMMLAHDLEERDLHLWRFMLSADYRGLGYGKQSVDLLIRMAKDAGNYNHISLDCSPKSAAAFHIYEKAGFRPTGEVNEGFVRFEFDLIRD